MKIRILLGLLGLTLVFWSCDEPPTFDNSNFVYNPFTFMQDTIHSVTNLEYGEADIEWDDHFRAWVGETKYYKSGFTMDFTINDSAFGGVAPDSIQLQIRHQTTFPENGSDTLASGSISFGFYNTTNQSIDLLTSTYGTFLGTDSMDVKNDNSYWNYTLPVGTPASQDTEISLGVFPNTQAYQSTVYGDGSPIRPSLVYFFHEPDSAGLDSATTISFLADTLFMYLEEQTGMFDRSNYAYIAQLAQDSIRMTIDLQDIISGTDTITHVISTSLLPAIEASMSSIYPLNSGDTVSAFHFLVRDEETDRTFDIDLKDNLEYTSNEIKYLVQDALDDDRSELSLVLKPNHTGYDPGFIAISKDETESAIYVHRSLAVRP